MLTSTCEIWNRLSEHSGGLLKVSQLWVGHGEGRATVMDRSPAEDYIVRGRERERGRYEPYPHFLEKKWGYFPLLFPPHAQ